MMIPLSSLFHVDGWTNLLTGLGLRGKDHTMSMNASQPRYFTDVELSAMGAGNGLCRQICSLSSEDMTRAGWEIGKDDGRLFRAMQKLKVPYKLYLALFYTELFGGALIVKEYDKGGPLDMPLDTRRGMPLLTNLRVYPASRVEYDSTQIVTDPISPYFESFERFKIKRIGAENVIPFMVHASRCIVFHGAPFGDTSEASTLTPKMKWWGIPKPTIVFNELAGYGGYEQGLAHLGQELSISKIKFSNMESIIANSDLKALRDRMEVIDMTKSLIQSVFLGKDEDFLRENLNLSGIKDLTDTFQMAVSSVSGYPVSKLFGRSSTGLNSTGQNEMEQYYSHCCYRQNTELLDPLLDIATTLNNNLKVIPLKEGDSLDISFNPLWIPSEKERSETYLNYARADDLYYSMTDVITGKEIRKARFVGGFSAEINVPSEDIDLGPNLGGEE